MISGFVQLGTNRIYREIRGEGHPFVLIHAGNLGSSMWDQEFEIFTGPCLVTCSLQRDCPSSICASSFLSAFLLCITSVLSRIPNSLASALVSIRLGRS